MHTTALLQPSGRHAAACTHRLAFTAPPSPSLPPTPTTTTTTTTTPKTRQTHQVREELDIRAVHLRLELHPVLHGGRQHRALVQRRDLLHHALQALELHLWLLGDVVHLDRRHHLDLGALLIRKLAIVGGGADKQGGARAGGCVGGGAREGEGGDEQGRWQRERGEAAAAAGGASMPCTTESSVASPLSAAPMPCIPSPSRCQKLRIVANEVRLTLCTGSRVLPQLNPQRSQLSHPTTVFTLTRPAWSPSHTAPAAGRCCKCACRDHLCCGGHLCWVQGSENTRNDEVIANLWRIGGPESTFEEWVF